LTGLAAKLVRGAIIENPRRVCTDRNGSQGRVTVVFIRTTCYSSKQTVYLAKLVTFTAAVIAADRRCIFRARVGTERPTTEEVSTRGYQIATLWDLTKPDISLVTK
jgi:hypothetical protein